MVIYETHETSYGVDQWSVKKLQNIVMVNFTF